MRTLSLEVLSHTIFPAWSISFTRKSEYLCFNTPKNPGFSLFKNSLIPTSSSDKSPFNKLISLIILLK